MFKILIGALCFFQLSVSFAATVNSLGGELYQGQEFVNENPTGRICYLYVDAVQPAAFGQHCTTMSVRPVYATDRNIQPQDSLKVVSAVTNYHRPEYPAIKTCAMNLNGQTSGNDIYGQDDTHLYNQLLSWEDDYQGNQFSFFVTISPVTKLPVRTRLHKLNWMSETDYDCLSLKRQ